ncbi:hypothetical protein J6590_062906 [Homalodisca vitripennis]|nr:hypothetical protein J6590_062906 [Homalodisca vitripennis]
MKAEVGGKTCSQSAWAHVSGRRSVERLAVSQPGPVYEGGSRWKDLQSVSLGPCIGTEVGGKTCSQSAWARVSGRKSVQSGPVYQGGTRWKDLLSVSLDPCIGAGWWKDLLSVSLDPCIGAEVGGKTCCQSAWARVSGRKSVERLAVSQSGPVYRGGLVERLAASQPGPVYRDGSRWKDFLIVNLSPCIGAVRWKDLLLSHLGSCIAALENFSALPPPVDLEAPVSGDAKDDTLQITPIVKIKIRLDFPTDLQRPKLKRIVEDRHSVYLRCEPFSSRSTIEGLIFGLFLFEFPMFLSPTDSSQAVNQRPFPPGEAHFKLLGYLTRCILNSRLLRRIIIQCRNGWAQSIFIGALLLKPRITPPSVVVFSIQF